MKISIWEENCSCPLFYRLRSTSRGGRLLSEGGPVCCLHMGGYRFNEQDNGDDGIRTRDLRLAKPALSQLSYIPKFDKLFYSPSIRACQAMKNNVDP